MWQQISIDDLGDEFPICSSRAWLNAALFGNSQVFLLKCEKCFFAGIIKQRTGCTVFEGLGAERRSSSGIISSTNNINVSAIDVESLPQGIDLIDLRRIPSNEVPFFFSRSLARNISMDDECYRLEIASDWPTFYSSLKRKFRQNMQSSRNRLLKQFPADSIVFCDYEVTSVNWSEVVKVWKVVDQNSWQGRKKLTAFYDSSKMQFFKKIVASDLEARVFLMYIHDVPVAIRWVFKSGAHALFYSIQFDMNFSKFRPGHLLTSNALKHCIERGIKVIDFGHGGAAHKKEWQALPVALSRILVPITKRGHALVLYQKARWFLGRKLRFWGCPR